MGVPHIVLLMMVSFAFGKGARGDHTGGCADPLAEFGPRGAQRGDQAREAQYVQAARQMGIGRGMLVFSRFVPHVLPQYLVGLVLLFPHAYMHEASITFLGFGLALDQPAIGVVLSEALKRIATGKWWLVLFPGLFLVAVMSALSNRGAASPSCPIHPLPICEGKATGASRMMPRGALLIFAFCAAT
jgi:peptide/nickel transport system permease protein